MTPIPNPEQLVDLRVRYGVSQSLLAQMLHVTERTVQRWESPAEAIGHRDIPLGLFELMLIKLGESPSSYGYASLTGAQLPPLAPPTAKGAPRRRAPRRKRAGRPKTPKPRAPKPKVGKPAVVKPAKPAKPVKYRDTRATPERLEELRQLMQNTLRQRI